MKIKTFINQFKKLSALGLVNGNWSGIIQYFVMNRATLPEIRTMAQLLQDACPRFNADIFINTVQKRIANS